MKCYKLVGLLVLLAVGSGLANPALGQADVGDSVARGQELYEQRNLSSARQLFETVLEVDSDNERSLYFLAQIARTQGDTQEAVEYFRRFADRSPEEFRHYSPVEAYRLVGEYLTRRDLYREALDVMARAEGLSLAEAQEEELEEWRRRARSGLESQERRDLREAFRDHVEHVNRVRREEGARAALDLLTNEEERFGELEEYRELRGSLEQRVELNSWRDEALQVDRTASADRMSALIERGEEYLEHDRDEFRERTRPVLETLYSVRGLRAYEEGEPEEARTWFERAEELESPPSSDRLHAMASLAYDEGDYRQAMNHLERLEERDPDYEVDASLAWILWLRTSGWSLFFPLVLLGLLGVAGYFGWPYLGRRLTTNPAQRFGTYLLSKGYPNLAATVFGWFCNVDGMKRHHVMNWQQALRQTDRTERLGEVLEQAHEHDLLLPDGIVDYAWYTREQEGDEAARPLLEDATEHWGELNPSRRARLAKVLSRILVDQGKQDQAFRVLHRLQKEQPPDSPLVQRLVRMAANVDRWDEWFDLGTSWLSAVKESYVQTDYQIGYSEDQREEDNELKDPASIARYLHELYRENRKVSLEEESIERVEFLLELIKTYRQDKEPIRKMLSTLVEKPLSDDKLLRYGKQLADLLREQKKIDQATRLYNQLHDRFPDDRTLKEDLADVFLDLDQRENALTLYRELLTGQSDHITARQGIQRIGERYENEGDYRKAEECYQFILNNSHVKKPNTLFRMAMAVYRQGRVEQALNRLQEIDQGDEEFQVKVITFVLRCMVELEKYDEAASRARDLDLDNPGLKPEVRRALRYWVARTHEGLEEYQTAMDHYQKITASDGEYADVTKRVERLENREGVQKGE